MTTQKFASAQKKFRREEAFEIKPEVRPIKTNGRFVWITKEKRVGLREERHSFGARHLPAPVVSESRLSLQRLEVSHPGNIWIWRGVANLLQVSQEPLPPSVTGRVAQQRIIQVDEVVATPPLRLTCESAALSFLRDTSAATPDVSTESVHRPARPEINTDF